eukprot:CAMPEP_0194257412 /NCGR_PEP_ID=MMETSP0158-20130606/38962_1 /TAXON_ID=33649 /ORGANISM="Thalassionema nitzschioides, Strain L26-B" /LENGTH=146 /DNA_ID=CAMNT_0038996439 /DNA_START=62 /DNA_END=502 /DNA_ORIENTATION=+
MMDEDYNQMIKMMDEERMGDFGANPVTATTKTNLINAGPHLSRKTCSLIIIACCMSLAVLFGASHEMVKNVTLRNIAVITGFDELFSSSEEERKLHLRKQLGYDGQLSIEGNGKQSSDVGNELLEMFLNIQHDSNVEAIDQETKHD